MIRLLLFLSLFTQPALAEPARVLSGEHGDFTRLVIELPSAEGWTLGRTPEGYAFAVRASAQPDYDLARVWQRIDRRRLASLDPANGALLLTLGCECHVFPFEYQPGIVVLDVKPGPPPAGSVFEADFVPPVPEGDIKPALQDFLQDRHYDWLTEAPTEAPHAAATLPLPLETGAISLAPLRDQLLEEIARGAAGGIVDMELPGKPPKGPFTRRETPWSNIRIGEEPGVIVTTPNGLVPENRPDAVCTAPERVDLSAWADDRSPIDLIAEARAGLIGEFDVPDETAVLRAVQLLLYLGFGAEARQTADLLPPDAAPDDLPILRSMSYLVDGDSDPGTPFATMLDCNGPAALWAALAQDRLPPGPGVNLDAIVQAFQALPAHLRRALGPALAEKFLDRNDMEAARMIRDAMQRAPDADPASVSLLDAKSELQLGNADAALPLAEAAVALDGDQADGLVALVEAHVRKLQPLDPGVAGALLALQGETEGTDAAPDLDRAIVLALALSSQAEMAFAQEGRAGGTEADLWRIVQSVAPDDTFLRHAVLPADAGRPEVDSNVGLAIGQRLMALGFPDAALVWLGPVSPTDAPELRLVAAQAESARGNAQGSAALLADLQGAEAEALRAQVLIDLGDLAAASAALATAGDTEGAARLDLWQGDWARLDPSAPPAWEQAAGFVRATPTDSAAGLLGRSGLTLDASLSSRRAIEDLLASVPSPVAN